MFKGLRHSARKRPFFRPKNREKRFLGTFANQSAGPKPKRKRNRAQAAALAVKD